MSTGDPSAEKRMRAAHQSLLASGDRWAAVLAMNGLLWGLQTAGQLPDSPTEYCAALAEAESVGSPHEIGMAHANLGRYYLYRGAAEDALPHLQEWLDRIARLHHKGTLASALEAIGEAAMLLGNPDDAARLLGAAGALRDSIGTEPRQTVRERIAHNLTRLRNELGEEQFRRAWAQGENLGVDEAVEAARTAGQPARAGVDVA
jgi:tetratricopeptide (TPR) repeat protein